MKRNTIFWIVGIAVVLIAVWFLFLRNKGKEKESTTSAGTGGGTIPIKPTGPPGKPKGSEDMPPAAHPQGRPIK